LNETVNEAPRLAWPPLVTTTLPEVVFGTIAVIEEGLQVTVPAATPLNVTEPLDPKLLPLIVTNALAGAGLGEMPVIFGIGPLTVNGTPLLACPLTVTTTFPVVAPLGTGATIDVALQLVGVAVVPLNFTVLVPGVEPNVVPVMVTDVPT